MIRTNLKCVGAIFSAAAWFFSSSINRLIIFLRCKLALYITNILNTVVILLNISAYCISVRYSFRSSMSNTLIPLINALVYLLSPVSWFNNVIKKFNNFSFNLLDLLLSNSLSSSFVSLLLFLLLFLLLLSLFLPSSLPSS
jgi:hypothetical protein